MTEIIQPSGFAVGSPPLIHLNASLQSRLSLVSALIEGPQQRWSDKLIDDIFHPREAAIIKSIPLSDSPSPDQLIWTRTNNSIFSVKSAYHLLVEESRQGSTSCSDTEGDVKF